MKSGHRACALALASLSISAEAHAYRTAADLPEFAGTERVRWPSLVVSYSRHNATPVGLGSTTIRDTLLEAFGVWTMPACSAVQFDDRGVTSLPARPEDGKTTIQWLESGWDELGPPADAAALTDVQYVKGNDGQWRIDEADLYLNAEHHGWALGAESDDLRDLRAVATHEAGHMLGLLHPCEIDGAEGAPDCTLVQGAREATMYPAYGTEQASLDTDDEAGVCFLYPAGECEQGCQPGSVCTPEGCRPGCGDTYCTSTEICDGAQCLSIGAGAESLGPELHEGALGATCADAADCDDGQCLAGVTEQPICTRTCGAGSAACPPGWECGVVDGLDVCAPKRHLFATGGGCHVAGNAQPVDGHLYGSIALLIGSSLRRARRRASRSLHVRENSAPAARRALVR